MKSVGLLVALCAFCGSAFAQSSECQSIQKASDRLACYDKLSPASNKAKAAAAAPSAPSTSTPTKQQGQLGDMLANENAQLDKRINNICRGC
jgi:hypothetical protein